MSEEYHEPIPTQYRGVRFRSKSEAIFARALELRGYDVWEYEPARYVVNDWTPDFFAVGQKRSPQLVVSLIIEYKPAGVTDAYKERLAENFGLLGTKTWGHFGALCCGNSFGGKPETYLLHGTKWEECEAKVGMFINIKEAARHRFDLT